MTRTKPVEGADPFELVQGPDGLLVHQGTLPGRVPIWDASNVSSSVVVGRPEDKGATAVLVIHGYLWQPPVGAVIQLGGGRTATVSDMLYQVDGEGLHSMVYVEDSVALR